MSCLRQKPLSESAAFRSDGSYKKYHELNGYIVTFVNGEPETEGSGKARIRIRRCPGFELLSETYDYHCRRGQTYHFEVTRQDGKLTFTVDGKVRLTAADEEPHVEGLLGFRTYRTKLWWDNLVIENLD